jgi:cytochrome bd ubiquinol oxidase subunit I
VPVVRAQTADFWAVLLNPSTINRLAHTLMGAFIVGAFFIMSISAYYLLRQRHEDFARRSFSGALIFATIFSLAQLVSGDANAKMVAHQQPAKLAAFEGLFHTGPARLSLLGLPDSEAGELRYEVGIPGLLSWLVYGDTQHPVTGLDRIRPEHRPPTVIPFASYHIMVGLGMFFIALTLTGSFLRWRGTLFQKRWLMWVFVLAVMGAVAANELGWAAAEVGRQPWVVHPRVLRDSSGAFARDGQGFLQYRMEEGLLTRDGVSESVRAPAILGSIILFSLVYLLLFAIWILVLNHKIHTGPEPVKVLDDRKGGGLFSSEAARADHRESMSDAKEPE